QLIHRYTDIEVVGLEFVHVVVAFFRRSIRIDEGANDSQVRNGVQMQTRPALGHLISELPMEGGGLNQISCDEMTVNDRRFTIFAYMNAKPDVPFSSRARAATGGLVFMTFRSAGLGRKALC